jgi:proline iminopeptidase
MFEQLRDRLDLDRVAGEPTAFYPPIEPYRTGRIRVSDLHELYFEEVGNPEGKPAVFLHGGPGAGLVPLYRQAFDPERYRVVLFDQRGSGQSTPRGELQENTTWHIVEDIERLREHLGIDQWLVFGGSWGGTLGLAYAQTHPERVTELVLRGVWLARQAEIDFEFRDGCNWIFPEAWEKFLAAIPESEHDDLVEAYYRRLTSADPDVRRRAARAWGEWESCKFSLVPNLSLIEEIKEVYDDVLALMECHYTRNRCWLETDTQLLDGVARIRHIPAVLVFGRYDMITPMGTAWALKKAWPEAELIVVPDEAHAFNEPGIAAAMVAATDHFADQHDK